MFRNTNQFFNISLAGKVFVLVLQLYTIGTLHQIIDQLMIDDQVNLK